MTLMRPFAVPFVILKDQFEEKNVKSFLIILIPAVLSLFLMVLLLGVQVAFANESLGNLLVLAALVAVYLGVCWFHKFVYQFEEISGEVLSIVDGLSLGVALGVTVLLVVNLWHLFF